MRKKNFYVLSSIQIFTFLVPLITSPYLARNLKLEGFGRYSIALSLIALLTVVIDYGYITAGVSRIANSSGDMESGNILLKSILTKALLFLLLSGCIYFFLPKLYPTAIDTKIADSMIIVLLFSILNNLWFYQALEKLGSIMLITFMARVVGLVLIFAFIKSPQDVPLAVILSGLPSFIIGIYSLFDLSAYLKLANRIMIKDILIELRSGLNFFLPNIYSSAFTNAGVIILGNFLPAHIVGGYAAIERLAKAIAAMNGPLYQAIFPSIIRSYSISVLEGDKNLIKIIQVSAPLFIGCHVFFLAFGGKIVYILFGTKYLPFIDSIPYLCLYLIFSYINTLIGVVYMNANKLEKEYSLLFMLTAFIGIAVYYIFPHIYGYLSAAIGLSVGEGFLTLGIMSVIYSVRKKC